MCWASIGLVERTWKYEASSCAGGSVKLVCFHTGTLLKPKASASSQQATCEGRLCQCFTLHWHDLIKVPWPFFNFFRFNWIISRTDLITARAEWFALNLHLENLVEYQKLNENRAVCQWEVVQWTGPHNSVLTELVCSCKAQIYSKLQKLVACTYAYYQHI